MSCDGTTTREGLFIFGLAVTDVDVTSRLIKGLFKAYNCMSWCKSSLMALV